MNETASKPAEVVSFWRNVGPKGWFEKNPALDDDPKAIAETRRYLEDVERVSQSTHSALEFYNAMIELYPERLNPTALWFWGARVLFPATVGA